MGKNTSYIETSIHLELQRNPIIPSLSLLLAFIRENCGLVALIRVWLTPYLTLLSDHFAIERSQECVENRLRVILRLE